MGAAFGPAEGLVTIGGLFLAGFVIWYFLMGEETRGEASRAVAGERQEITMVVKGGYSPSTLVLKQGVPARLVVDRQESGECSEELLIPGILPRKFLPPYEKTVIEFTPEKTGEFEITCGMGMLHGKLIVT
jgi:Cu+-exporting ATPase